MGPTQAQIEAEAFISFSPNPFIILILSLSLSLSPPEDRIAAQRIAKAYILPKPFHQDDLKSTVVEIVTAHQEQIALPISFDMVSAAADETVTQRGPTQLSRAESINAMEISQAVPLVDTHEYPTRRQLLRKRGA